ncbi:hypothetical protein BS50DRAFT_342953 [Corynespora cassiicola Philippines]|uniref:Uncharacterized protein n=1 Tax=Corynespora cassiicola Philippines TaxID=1448308 RepID=A0A2T2NVR4_CORCC|nr:hypothetical protein BS50DRAFT_342953 [Corynespora cassiicola Philippines]
MSRCFGGAVVGGGCRGRRARHVTVWGGSRAARYLESTCIVLFGMHLGEAIDGKTNCRTSSSSLIFGIGRLGRPGSGRSQAAAGVSLARLSVGRDFAPPSSPLLPAHMTLAFTTSDLTRAKVGMFIGPVEKFGGFRFSPKSLPSCQLSRTLVASQPPQSTPCHQRLTNHYGEES